MPMKVRYTVVNGQVIAENRNGVRKTYVPDPSGSTIALLDDKQKITDTFSYFPLDLAGIEFMASQNRE